LNPQPVNFGGRHIAHSIFNVSENIFGQKDHDEVFGGLQTGGACQQNAQFLTLQAILTFTVYIMI